MVEISILSPTEISGILGVSQESEIPSHLKTLIGAKEISRSHHNISATPCYPTYGNPEAEEG